MRTIVYVDGFNLYYGLLRGKPWLWLDLEKLATMLLTDRYNIILQEHPSRSAGEVPVAGGCNASQRALDPPPTCLGVKAFTLKFALVFANVMRYNDFVLPVKG